MADGGGKKPRGMSVQQAEEVCNVGESEAIARLRGDRKRSKPHTSERGINWTGVREEYVTGGESYAQVAKRLGVSPGAVELHASDRRNSLGATWADAREDFREDVARTFRMESAKRQVDEALSVHEKQIKHVADLVAAAMPVALEALGCGSVSGADAVKVALAALRAQSNVHGLERATAARLELTGKDGGPIEHDLAFDGRLDEATATLAERAIEAIFGQTADAG